MARQRKWTNETTRRVAHGLLKLCQPSDNGDNEAVDWQQVIDWLQAQRDVAIHKRDRARKPAKT
jgi:hypothetical protein